MTGLYKGLICLPETRYLAAGVMMPWENNLDRQFGCWREMKENGMLDQMRERCGGEIVGLFCYHCDMEKRMFSYHVACENRSDASPGPFEELILKALCYARFEDACASREERFATYERLCEAFWGQWLPQSGYVSLIEPETGGGLPGYAAVERYQPEAPLGACRMELLFPVAKNAWTL